MACYTCCTPSVCPQGITETRCVKYSGKNLPNTGINTGDPMEDVLEKIDESIGGNLILTYLASSPTVAVTGSGSSFNPFTMHARLSLDAGNELSTGTDGALYVPPPTSSALGFDI